MKTRMVLGLSLLALVLAMGAGSAVWMRHATEPVTQDLERAALLVEQGQPEQGKVLALRAKKTWVRTHSTPSGTRSWPAACDLTATCF